MKKLLLLFASAALLSVSAFAQAIVIDGSSLGLNSDYTTVVPAGTVLGSNDAITLSIEFEDTYKTISAVKNNYSYYVLNGDSIDGNYAIQGSTNPKVASGASPSNTLLPPTTGSVLRIDAKKDGVVAVWGALSTNKSYTVFEDTKPIGYRLVMQTSSTLGNIDITIPTDENGAVTEPIAWPEVIASGGSENTVKSYGNGYIIFDVKAGSSYLVNANGTKIIAGGAFYNSDKYFTAAIAGSDYLELYKEDAPSVDTTYKFSYYYSYDKVTDDRIEITSDIVKTWANNVIESTSSTAIINKTISADATVGKQFVAFAVPANWDIKIEDSDNDDETDVFSIKQVAIKDPYNSGSSNSYLYNVYYYEAYNPNTGFRGEETFTLTITSINNTNIEVDDKEELPKVSASVSPAVGEVSQLSSYYIITVADAEGVTVNSVDDVVIYDVKGDSIAAKATGSRVMYNMFQVLFEAPITTPGEYELRIPASAYSVEGQTSVDLAYSYTIAVSPQIQEVALKSDTVVTSLVSPIVIEYSYANVIKDATDGGLTDAIEVNRIDPYRGSIYVVLSDVQISGKQILIFIDDAENAAEGDYTILINQGIFSLDGVENDEANFKVTYEAPKQDYVTVNPAEGEVEGLQSFTLTFNNATEVAAAFSREAYPVLYNVTEGHNEFSWTSAVVEGNTLTLTTNAPVVYMGEYELRIPGASYTVDTVAGQDLVLKYTVVASEKTQEYTLANDTVHTMPLVVTFPNVKSVVLNDSLSFSDPYIKVAQAGDTEGEAEIETSTSSNQLLINVAAADLVNGEFTLTIPAGTLWLDGVANTEIVENFTYELLVPDYTLVVTPSDSTTLSAIDVITVNVEGVDEVAFDLSSVYYLVLQSDSLTYLAKAAINEEDSTQLVITVIDGDTEKPTSITTPGEYTLYINANVITVNGVKVPTVTEIKFTVGVPTGISRILGDAAVKNIYNLRGVKVDAKTLTPGIYVIDGKKVQLR